VPARVRLDQRLLELGLETSRARAQACIRAGRVWLGDRRVDKPGALVPADAVPSLSETNPYVSRGGQKLAGALDALRVDPRGKRCADVGAATGGFTDCLLQRGARSVLAIDVGYGQLAYSLRNDPRVTLLERTNVRNFELSEGEAPFDLVTADLSFISLCLVLPRLAALAAPGGELLLLVKPQFELDRRDVGPRGVVRDAAKRDEAVRRVRERAEALGLEFVGESESTLPGPKGNRERFLLLRRPRTGAPC
jgi:23S rRNA (cytidine1920-2'-O)/16S rRNA (cytidine1409-2'-O)-methyltransferase